VHDHILQDLHAARGGIDLLAGDVEVVRRKSLSERRTSTTLHGDL